MGDPDTALATRLPCTFGVLTELSADEIAHVEIDPGEKLCVTTKLDSDAYVYVVQIELVSAAATTVWMMYPDDPDAGPLRASGSVRLPASDTWFEPRATGQVRALVAPRRLRAADMSDLLGGREPLPGTVSVKNAKTGAGWP